MKKLYTLIALVGLLAEVCSGQVSVAPIINYSFNNVVSDSLLVTNGTDTFRLRFDGGFTKLSSTSTSKLLTYTILDSSQGQLLAKLTLDATSFDSSTTGPTLVKRYGFWMWKFSGADPETLTTSYHLPANYEYKYGIAFLAGGASLEMASLNIDANVLSNGASFDNTYETSMYSVSNFPVSANVLQVWMLGGGGTYEASGGLPRLVGVRIIFSGDSSHEFYLVTINLIHKGWLR